MFSTHNTIRGTPGPKEVYEVCVKEVLRVTQDIKQYCQACLKCQQTAGRRFTPKAQVVSLPIIEVLFSWIAMDIVGPLERSRRGNKYILVVCDYATRYPEAFPLKSIDYCREIGGADIMSRST